MEIRCHSMHPSSQHCYGEVGDGGALEAHWPASLCRLKLSNRPDLREDVRQDQCLRLYSDFHTHAMGLVCPRLPTLTSHSRVWRMQKKRKGGEGERLKMLEKAAL